MDWIVASLLIAPVFCAGALFWEWQSEKKLYELRKQLRETRADADAALDTCARLAAAADRAQRSNGDAFALIGKLLAQVHNSMSVLRDQLANASPVILADTNSAFLQAEKPSHTNGMTDRVS